MKNKKTASLREFIRQPYAWPGGYPLYAIMSDGSTLCKTCAKTEYRQIVRSTRAMSDDGWRFMCVDINYEDQDLYCEHCGTQIESAYGED